MANRSRQQVEAARRRAEVVQLRTAGIPFEQIGQRLGVTAQRVHQLYCDALAKVPAGPVHEHRRLEEIRLDRLQRAAETVLRATHHVIQGGEVVRDEDGKPYVDHGPTLNAIRALLAVAERRARLLGLDASTRVDARVDLRAAWERATPEEHLSLLGDEIAVLEAEMARRGPATPPAAETIAAETDEELLAEALAAGLAAAGVDLDDAALDRLAAGVETYLRRRNGGRS